MSQDAALLRELRAMWETLDPPPADLAERVLFTLRLEDLEFELMRLQAELEPAGARGDDAVRGQETVRTVTFGSESLTVMVTLSEPQQRPRRIDGWIAPPAPLRVELRSNRGRQEVVADADGRFAFPDAPAGLVQLVFHPTADIHPGLGRPVVTPAIHLH